MTAQSPSPDLNGLAGTITADGRYRFDAFAGEGSFGVVYRGHDLHLDQVVAIKLFDDSAGAIEIDVVLDEARIQRLCAHENIVDVYNVSIMPPLPFVAMEYVAGGSIEDRIGQVGVPYADALRWSRDALDGLAHAHGLGVLHRDIKPGNLLLGPRGEAMLSDFGLAEDTVRHRVTSEAVYLPHAAPELYAYQPSTVQTDIWAMGATLYRLVTGEYPFTGDLEKILRGEYTPPQRLNPQVSSRLTRVIARSLEPDPDARYRQATEMLGELTSCRAVGSWQPQADQSAIDAWAADLPEGRATVRLLRTRNGHALEVKLDRGGGAGARRVGRDRPYPSEAKARQAMATVLRRSTQGYGLG